jgi:hypothetical protein
VRARQEAAHRRSAGPRRRRAVLFPGRTRRAWRLGSCRRLHAPALLRLLRLFRHGDRARLADRIPLPPELQLAAQGREHLGLLAALAT